MPGFGSVGARERFVAVRSRTARVAAVKMTPSHPGDFVRTEIIEALGLSVTKAAEVLGVRRATLSALLHAKATLSPEMALRIEKAFGVSMDMLMRMQAWHDTAKAHEIKVRRYAAA